MILNNYFDDDIADHYDESSADMFKPEVITPCVDYLAELAGKGKALEFGIGTGRIALPLLEREIPVYGIDLSAAMIEKLQQKDRGTEIPVVAGDFSQIRIEGSFSLVYLVFNTIMNITGQKSQVACFRNAAAHLSSGGYFVIEVLVPALQKLPFGEKVRPFLATADRWGFDEYNVCSQEVVSHHFEMKGEKTLRYSVPFRYVWPAELDLMAELAGMDLAARWGSWKKEPFHNCSESHISVWRRR